MKEINIAKTITHKRREKNITQEDLAEYMGVSKASVSKWETGQSYPDITLLPQLAAYFNISIDQLMDYSPQLTKDDIKKLYHKLAKEFSEKPFDEVYLHCEALIKKYYACFPFLIRMCVLYINHYMLADAPEKGTAMIEEVMELCIRIKTESEDSALANQAIQFQGLCLLMLNRPAETVDLLEDTDQLFPTADDCSLLANAYLALGKSKRAEEALQRNFYTHLMLMLNEVPMLLSANADNLCKAELIIERGIGLAELFNVEELNFNTILIICLAAAETYAKAGEKAKAMKYLQKYTDICDRVRFPVILRGDSFFDHIDSILEGMDLEAEAPREENVIRESMVQALACNPAFSGLCELPEYQVLIKRLEGNRGEMR